MPQNRLSCCCPTQRGKPLEALAVLFPAFKLTVSVEPCSGTAVGRISLPDNHESFRMLVRQRPQKDRLHNAEDRCSHSDSQRQCHNGCCCESRRSPQLTKGN